MHKDSAARTILVSISLCIVCSVLVTFSATLLRSKQEKNKQLDIKKNLLLASGLIKKSKPTEQEILKAYESVVPVLIDLETGETIKDISFENFDQRKMAKDPQSNHLIPRAKDLAGIKRRSKYSVVYKINENSKTTMLILPVNGKGLWSTLYGFIALAPDTKTIKGIGFYEHGETAGLGGEVDNVMWKKQWVGKVALDDNFKPIFKVNKGPVDMNLPSAKHKVDGLSGATITSNGVTGLVNYWLGNDGFGPYLAKFRSSNHEKRSSLL